MRSRLIHKNSRTFVLALLSILFCVIGAQAQSSSFTYQGRLTDNRTQPTATYDMEFRLFDASEGGNPLPLGNPITITFTDPPRGVSVANGVFTVQLDFGGAAAFDGNPRWLQIAVKKPTDSSFVTLNPRQPITSTPYAITATNSSQLDGRAASDYVLTADSRMNDARTPTAGSGDYIQKNTSFTAQDASFNISGDGRVHNLTAGQGLFASQLDYDFLNFGLLSIGANHATGLQIGRSNIPINITGGFVHINAVDTSAIQFSANRVLTRDLDTQGSPGGENLSIAAFNATTVSIGKPTTFFGLLTANNGISTNTETISGDLTVGGTINGTVSNANNAANLGGVAASQYIRNGTSPQPVDFNISGNGTVGTLTATNVAVTGTEPPPVIFGDGISAPDVLRVVGAKGGDTLDQFGGSGGNVLIQAGDGGHSSNNFGGAGGSITLQPGASGNGPIASASGSVGNVLLAPSTGRVGIGTSNPVFRLDVVDSSAAGLRVVTNSSGGTVASFGSTGNFEIDKPFVNGGRFIVKEDGNVGIGTTSPQSTLEILKAAAADTVGGDLILNRFYDGESWRGASLFSYFPTVHGHDVLAFGVSESTTAPNTIAAVKMVISATGNVGIGTTAPDNTLTVNGSADKPGGGSWGTFSDERLKNIKGRFAPGLKAVMQLQPLRYEYKPDNALGIKSSGEHIGFSAQAVEKILPEAVTKNDKGYRLVNNDPILWTMLNAIKEQQSQIESQKTLIQSQQKLLETQQRQIEQQQRQVDALKRLVCSMKASADICRKEQ